MYALDCFLALVKELPGLLDIVVRYCYELAMYAISILSNAL